MFTLFFFYLLLKKTGNRKFALLGFFLLAINPWHITMSRWALESNFVIVFLVGGLYFFLKGLENERFFPASALFFGLSLYCYALVWIPSLSGMRTGEFAFSNILVPIRNVYRFFVSQDDGLIWSSAPGFGYYYLFSLPFILAGAVVLFQKTVQSVKSRVFSVHALFFFHLLCSLAVGLSQLEINANRFNVIHIPAVYCCAVGVYTAFRMFQKVIPQTILLAYVLSFAAFCAAYFTSYSEEIAEAFGWEESQIINAAISMAGENGTIRTDKSFDPLKVLYYTKFPAPDFVETVYYPNEPSPWLIIDSFGRYVFHIDYENLDPEAVYIIRHEDIPLFEKQGYIIDRFYTYALAHMENP